MEFNSGFKGLIKGSQTVLSREIEPKDGTLCLFGGCLNQHLDRASTIYKWDGLHLQDPSSLRVSFHTAVSF